MRERTEKSDPDQIAAKILKVSSTSELFDLIENPEIKSLIILICSSPELGDLIDAKAANLEHLTDAPQWAKNAAGEFFRRCNFASSNESREYRLGFLLGFLNGFRKEPCDSGGKAESHLLETVPQIENLMLNVATTDGTPGATIKFFEGYLDGQKRSGEFSPLHTAYRYLAFATHWREAARLKTNGEVHAWLSKRRISKRSYDEPSTAELKGTRNICTRIGFPLLDKGGRPPKRKPSHRRAARVV